MLAAVSALAGAHDMLTADTVQAYLSRVSDLQATMRSADSVDLRAQASLQLGQTLDEIGELLNGDLQAHGKVQGLASSVLMSELATHGAPLAHSARANRFTSNLRYYRDALHWAPAGATAQQASFRLLKGRFYQALGDDPLQPEAQSREQLAEQIRLGEALRRVNLQSSQHEETAFILAVHYMQAARAATATGDRRRYLGKAQALADEFARKYPDSLRAATLSTLLAGLAKPE